MSAILIYGAVFVATPLALIYLWFLYSYTYWSRRGVLGPKPVFPIGNLDGVFSQKSHFSDPLFDCYFKYKREPFVGLYALYKPLLLVNDAELVKSILVRGFYHFQSHNDPIDPKLAPLSEHLFSLHGQKWKVLRAKLSPTFTSGKMKNMFGTVLEVGNTLEKYCEKLAVNKEVVEFKELYSKYTTDVIGKVAFGIECNNFEGMNPEFRRYANEYVSPTTTLGAIKSMVAFFAPKLVSALGMPMEDKRMVTFYMDMVKDTIIYREKNQIVKNDFMQLLIQIKNNCLTDDDGNLIKSEDGSSFTMSQITAQAFVFFLAGFDTSSSVASFAVYEMALNPEIQERVRRDILEVLAKYDGECTYEALSEMRYLNMVIDETLRKYPPLNMLFRTCTADYEIPGSQTTIEKGTTVFIPIGALHMDPDNFLNPQKFDPERFSPENREKIKPFSYLPFGDGPRVCIGRRFGLVQSKLALVKTLCRYEVEVCEETPIPININKQSFLYMADGGINLKLKMVKADSKQDRDQLLS